MKIKLLKIGPEQYGVISLTYEVDGKWGLYDVCGTDMVIDEDGQDVKGRLKKHALNAVRGIAEMWQAWTAAAEAGKENVSR
jgi:hypothetical protein